MTINKRLVALGFSFLPLIFVLVMFPSIPEIIPAHFKLGGVTRYGSRIEILITPAATVVFQLLWVAIEKIIVRQKESGTQNAKMLFVCNLITTLIFAVVTIWHVFAAIDGATTTTEARFDLLRMLAVMFSVMYIAMGNFLPKCKQNWLVGIRIFWTLKSEHNWFKTHRFGGKAFIIFGIAAMPICLFALNGSMGMLFMGAGTLALLVIICCYSYRIHKLENVNK